MVAHAKADSRLRHRDPTDEITPWAFKCRAIAFCLPPEMNMRKNLFDYLSLFGMDGEFAVNYLINQTTVCPQAISRAVPDVPCRLLSGHEWRRVQVGPPKPALTQELAD